MHGKAFTLTSNEYCGECGSFDLVKIKQSWISKRLFGIKHSICCFGCDHQFSETDFTKNAIRTVPLTVDDFFFQTNINNLRLLKHQIRPVTYALSYCLIASAVIALFLVKTPGELHKPAQQQIEWDSTSLESAGTYEAQLVNSLQLEFEQLLKN